MAKLTKTIVMDIQGQPPGGSFSKAAGIPNGPFMPLTAKRMGDVHALMGFSMTSSDHYGLVSHDLENWQPMFFPSAPSFPYIIDRAGDFFTLTFWTGGIVSNAFYVSTDCQVWTPASLPLTNPGANYNFHSPLIYFGGYYYVLMCGVSIWGPPDGYEANRIYRTKDLTNWELVHDFSGTYTIPFGPTVGGVIRNRLYFPLINGSNDHLEILFTLDGLHFFTSIDHDPSTLTDIEIRYADGDVLVWVDSDSNDGHTYYQTRDLVTVEQIQLPSIPSSDGNDMYIQRLPDGRFIVAIHKFPTGGGQQEYVASYLVGSDFVGFQHISDLDSSDQSEWIYTFLANPERILALPMDSSSAVFLSVGEGDMYGGKEFITLPRGMYHYVTIVNPTNNMVYLFQDRTANPDTRYAIGKVFPYTQRTIPITDSLSEYTVKWVDGGPEDVKRLELYFTDDNLMLSGGLGADTQSVILSGDTVGLAKQSQFPESLKNGGLRAYIVGSDDGPAFMAEVQAIRNAVDTLAQEVAAIRENEIGDYEEITPDDSNDLPQPAIGFYCGVGGDVTVDTPNGIMVKIPSARPGTVYPFPINKVWATGTTALDIVAIYGRA